MFWKKWLKDYLSFGRRDRIGVIALIILIWIIYLLPVLFRNERQEMPVPSEALAAAIDSLETGEDLKFKSQKSKEEPYRSRYPPSGAKGSKDFTGGELFRFDPNTLAVEGWVRLGLSEKTARTIEKYRSKGGKFYKPEDLQKIWGLPPGFYERVKDYVEIAPRAGGSSLNNERRVYKHSEKIIQPVNINSADTGAFIDLPGIGSRLAVRIVGFRDKLGGFFSVEQVREVYGLADSVFQKIKTYLRLDGAVKKFNLNSVTKEELKLHPYFKWNLANAIVEYRKQHGAFKSLEELKKIAVVDEGMFERIVNYLEL